MHPTHLFTRAGSLETKMTFKDLFDAFQVQVYFESFLDLCKRCLTVCAVTRDRINLTTHAECIS
jgi:hypothetical protein